MIEFKIYETFDCVGFDLYYIGDVSYFYKNKELLSVDVDLSGILLDLTHEYVDIKPCLSDSLLNQLQKELEDYFWKSSYWEEKYLDAITV